MPILTVLQCCACEHTVWVEAGGKADWDGSCPKCSANAWTYLRETRDWTEWLRNLDGA